jgi:hypothetical protein
MLPRCVYCWSTEDLVKCKLVGCSNLLCPDHVKNHGVVPAAGNLETGCCVGGRWANREDKLRHGFCVAEEIKKGKSSPSARLKLGSSCLKRPQVISGTLA